MGNNNEKMEVLITAKDYTGKLCTGISSVVSYYQGGNEATANEIMIDVIDGLQWLVEALEVTQDIQTEKIDIKEMNEFLVEMINAFENTDYVLLSDLLEYEVLPVLEKWEASLILSTGA